MKRIPLPAIILALIAIVGWFVTGRAPSQQGGAQFGGAQSAGGGQSGGLGGNNAFSQFRESHKYTFMLMKLVGNIGRLERDAEAPLTPDQAKAIVAALSPLREQPSLSQDEAKNAVRKIKTVLTARQLTKIGKMKQPARHPGAGGQAQGGPGGSGGQKPSFDPSAMANFNPLNAQANNPMSARSGKMMDAVFMALQSKASGEKMPAGHGSHGGKVRVFGPHPGGKPGMPGVPAGPGN